MDPDDASHGDKRHGGKDHQAVVDVAVVVTPLRNDLISQQSAATEQFAEESHDDEDNGITRSVAYAVEERRPRLVRHGEGLQTSHQYAVGDYQADKY